jgi:hypothetical protein
MIRRAGSSGDELRAVQPRAGARLRGKAMLSTRTSRNFALGRARCARVLLCFWYSRDDQWNRDLDDVPEYCERDADLALQCADRFPTQLYGVASAYFAAAALNVT